MEEFFKSVASKIATKGDIIAISLGIVIGIPLMIYLVLRGYVPEKYDFYIPLAIGLFFLAVKNIYDQVAAKKTSSEDLSRRASSLSNLLKSNKIIGILPPTLHNELELNFDLWVAKVVTDDEFSNIMERIEKAIKETINPTINRGTAQASQQLTP